MRFVFFGSFRLSADILEAYIASGGTPPVAVICSPDRPAGRKKIMTPPAIKKLILGKGWPITILQPESLAEIPKTLQTTQSDFFVVMGYPKILSKEILSIPPLGTLGVHPSLLPLYRGSSPIQSALLDGVTETGITLYHMDEKMDHGKIVASNALQIADNDTNLTLEKKLARVAGTLLVATLPKFLVGEIAAIDQDHSKATFTRKFTTADAEVDMAKDAPQVIYNKIRAFTPEPGAWTMNLPGREGARVKLLEATMNQGALTVTEIQPDGKKPIKITHAVKT